MTFKGLRFHTAFLSGDWIFILWQQAPSKFPNQNCNNTCSKLLCFPMILQYLPFQNMSCKAPLYTTSMWLSLTQWRNIVEKSFLFPTFYTLGKLGRHVNFLCGFHNMYFKIIIIIISYKNTNIVHNRKWKFPYDRKAPRELVPAVPCCHRTPFIPTKGMIWNQRSPPVIISRIIMLFGNWLICIKPVWCQ